jgi:hypothetical protein
MKRTPKPPRTGTAPSPDVPHPFETLLAAISTDSIDPSDAAREAQWARSVRSQMETRIAALRRQLTPSPPAATRKPTPVSAELLGLGRGALLARLATLRQSPEVRIAHLGLTRLTDSDLRQLVAEIENERAQS